MSLHTIALPARSLAEPKLKHERDGGILIGMKLTVLYRERSEHAREVTTFIEMMRRHYPDKRADLEDVDTREGAATASLYGIMQYPAVIITTMDGRVMFHEEGLPMPIVGQVAGQLQSQTMSV